jgi:Fic family protein
MKRRIRGDYRFYSQDLLNNLFNHPYTKISLIQKDLGVSRQTATRYLNELVEGGVLEKQRVGRTNYYINVPLVEALTEGG